MPGAAVLNTNTATAVALLVWTMLDKMAYGKPSVIGAVNGMIAGLVAITPAAGYVNGWGAIIIGVCAGIIPWMSMNWLQKTKLMMKVDDTLSVFSTHGVAGLIGGLLTGILANPDMLEYIGTDKDAPGRQRHRPDLRQLPPASAAGLRRAVHHRLQRHRHLHHPQGDLVHHAAAHGRGDAEGRRRRGARRDRLRDRRRRRVAGVFAGLPDDRRSRGGAGEPPAPVRRAGPTVGLGGQAQSTPGAQEGQDGAPRAAIFFQHKATWRRVQPTARPPYPRACPSSWRCTSANACGSTSRPCRS